MKLEHQVTGKEKITCKVCGTVFEDYVCKHRKFCSRECFDEYHSKNRSLRGGGYQAVHMWLKKHYGNPDRCENKDCDGKSTTYHWALKHGCSCTHNRSNFRMLCASCHRLYDMTSKEKERVKRMNIGRELSEEHKKSISESCKGIHKDNQHAAKTVIQYNKNGNRIKRWSSITQVAEALDVSVSGISMCCNGHTNSSGGFIWKFLSK